MKTLKEIQGIPRCTMADIGMTVTPHDDADAEAKAVAEDLTILIENYLYDFAAPNKCPQCGESLGGMFGSFAWGLVHGEGRCTGPRFSGDSCNWPVRGYHRIKDKDGKEIFDRVIELLLPYHPNHVSETLRKKSR